jgi:hypothetical protein
MMDYLFYAGILFMAGYMYLVFWGNCAMALALAAWLLFVLVMIISIGTDLWD